MKRKKTIMEIFDEIVGEVPSEAFDIITELNAPVAARWVRYTKQEWAKGYDEILAYWEARGERHCYKGYAYHDGGRWVLYDQHEVRELGKDPDWVAQINWPDDINE